MIAHKAISKITNYLIIALSFLFVSEKVNAQTEVEPWGNIRGIRMDGELMEFETSIIVADKNFTHAEATQLEHQHPSYHRNANTQTIETKLDSFYFKEDVMEDIAHHSAQINLHYTSTKNAETTQLYYCISLPAAYYSDGKINVTNDHNVSTNISIASISNKAIAAQTINALSLKRQLNVKLQSSANIILSKQKDGNINIYVPISSNQITNNQQGDFSLNIIASGKVNKEPVTLKLNTKDTGATFAGFGGNFRLQNPEHDPQVIDYCLSNMRVAYSRVEMPWMQWQPDENSNPIDSAKAGKLNQHVKESMEMVQRLSKMNIPVILTAWFPPQWAVVGKLNLRHIPDGEWGNAIDSTKADKIYKSITDYITYLKDANNVEVSMFSFNESDLGINIRQTGEEHATLIKGLGAYMKQHGLQTKMLLGDNSDATTYSFIYPAMKDTAILKYIGAISFHSWRGWDSTTLQKWRDAADEMHLPLLVGEGSIDAAAWNYPEIFQEPVYALKEINLYVRLLSICQPLSILQWQLTSDYSPLIGGGIFGNKDSLHPGQRFYNLKQLASVPANLQAMQVTTSSPFITCAAQGNNEKKIYAVHIINNGAELMADIKGLPASVKSIDIFTTNNKDYMKHTTVSPGVNKLLQINLAGNSYITLICKP